MIQINRENQRAFASLVTGVLKELSLDSDIEIDLIEAVSGKLESQGGSGGWDSWFTLTDGRVIIKPDQPLPWKTS